MRGKRPLAWPVKFNDRPFGIGLIEDGFTFGQADQQTVETDAIELPGDTVAELVSSSDEGIGKRATFDPGNAKVVFDVGGRLFQSEGQDVVADVDALVESFKAFELEHIAQVRLA